MQKNSRLQFSSFVANMTNRIAHPLFNLSVLYPIIRLSFIVAYNADISMMLATFQSHAVHSVLFSKWEGKIKDPFDGFGFADCNCWM